MRLIDADALRDAIISHRPSALRTDPVSGVINATVDEAVDEIDATPTIACETCGHWEEWTNPSHPRVGGRYCSHDDLSDYGSAKEYLFAPPADFGCNYWKAREEGS